jgi:DNA-binding transcriptional LysR family regulator
MRVMASFDNLDWDDLKVFLQAARVGNFSGAARRLRIDHSTVSRRIANLEMVLGFSVFERQQSGLRVNDLGERLLRHAESIESAVFALKEEISGGDASASSRVRLATMEGIASLYLARRFARFRETHPSITVELVTSPQTVYVNRREADLFLSFFKPPGQGLVSQRLGRFRLNLYASATYLERCGTPASRDDLGDHDYVSYITDLIQVDTVRWLDDVIRSPRIVFQSNSMIAQLNAASGGMGLVLLPEFAVEGRSDLVPLLKDVVGTTRELWINVHTDLQYAARVKAVVGFLKQTFTADAIMQVEDPRRPGVSAA